MTRRGPRAWHLAALVLLVGCASPPTAPTAPDLPPLPGDVALALEITSGS